jgi:DNA-binding beta-propeller fold protein YncE
VYRVDAGWPKALPNNWILGQVSGLAVDSRDHVWILHRPLSIPKDQLGAAEKPPATKCCVHAPAVLELDPAGNVVQAWGGPGQAYDWPKNEHGLHVDAEGNVWIAANDPLDNQVLKFTREGNFLLQIGKPGKSQGSNSKVQLGRPAHMDTDLAASEVYIADGYGNRRVAVFDAKTGAYKRHWGAYGGIPSDEKLPSYSPTASGSESFNNAVHCVRLSRDGLVYVCDRRNNRVQVFQKDGTFVKEFFVERQTLAGQTVAEIAFSPDPRQGLMYVADGPNGEVQILNRADGKPVGRFGRMGPMAGEFRNLHNIASDSKGNIYTAEAGIGRRVQKFVRAD